MDATTPPLWLIFISSSFFAIVTRAKAHKYGRNQKFWFWIGFTCGIMGLLAFYITKSPGKKTTTATINKKLTVDFALVDGAWYYALDQTIQGPVSSIYLKNLFQKGSINIGTLVWHESLSEWVKLEIFKG